MTRSIAIVGAGVLGCTAALLAARRGWRVTLLDRAPRAWSGASASGEGKVHLGLVYALGDAATQRHILGGALSFARVLETAVGRPLPWSRLASEPFRMVVMPDSLLPVEALAERYAALDALLRAEHPGAAYLGAPLPRLHEPAVVADPATGRPALDVAERAVHPARLRAIVLEAIEREPRIRVLTGRRVLAVDDDADGVVVRHTAEESDGRGDAGASPAGASTTLRADAALLCAWESQAALHADPHAAPLSLRFKTALTIPAAAIDLDRCRTMTLVVGPYGDVVRRDDSVYASWYPAGRLVHEQGLAPSVEARAQVAAIDAAHPTVDEQLAALTAIGALPPLRPGGRERVSIAGGWIVAEGDRDIDRADSGLHDRHGDVLAVRGRVLSPRNWKFSTAPLAAERAVAALGALLDGEAAA